jgi:hypothetical protein
MNYRLRGRLAPIIAALCACYGSAAAQTVVPEPSDFRFSGFGTMGVAYVDAPEGWAYKRDLSQADNVGKSRADLDTRLGLQLNYTPVHSFELVAQVVATRRNAAASGGDAVEWAFAAWRPHPEWTVRGGRVNMDAFLLADYRNVGFAYPLVRPPVELYSQLPRSIDGADLTHDWNVGRARWRAKVFAGRAFTFADAASRIEGRPTTGLMASREADGLLIRASALRTRSTDEIASVQPLIDALGPLTRLPFPEIASQASELRHRLSIKDSHLTYLAFGARHESRDWLLSAEYTRVTGHPTVAYSSGYASVGRRFGPITAFATNSRVRSSSPSMAAPNWEDAITPVLGPAVGQQAQYLADISASAINRIRVEQGTWSVGARYDLDARSALKVQWDWIRVEPNGGRFWGGIKGPGPIHSSVGSLVVDFVF